MTQDNRPGGVDLTFFKPLWRRVALTAAVCVWSAVEWINSNTFWGTVTALAILYLIWTLFLNFPDDEPGEDNDPPSDAGPSQQ